AGLSVHSDSYVSYFFFFFQAEDGIRDWSVTGVQTCALPISSSSRPMRAVMTGAWMLEQLRLWPVCGPQSAEGTAMHTSCRPMRRSEERRVGKEGRTGGGPDH